MKLTHNESTQSFKRDLYVAQNQISKFRNELYSAKIKVAIFEKQNSNKDLVIASLIPTPLLQLPTGILEWKVTEVKQRMQNKEISFSDPFYVGLYKCQGNIYWDFNNTEKLGVFICIMRSDFDAKLHWPIRYKYTIILINQINSKVNFVDFDEVIKEDLKKYPNSLKRPSDYRNKGLGTASFISNTTILEEKYYRQDSITFHISVELLPSL